MNKSDSERVRTVIEAMGYQWTDEEEEAGLLGILACSVRQKSIDKVYSRIARWNKWKNNRALITFVSGCVLPADREKFLKLFDLVFSMAELPEFPNMIKQYGVVTMQQPATPHLSFAAKPRALGLQVNNGVMLPPEKIKNFWQLKPTYQSGYEAFIPIQNGCDKFCTYCAVPYTRGREISRPSGEVLAELKLLVDKGYKAITLLGQNVNSYGLDKHGAESTFADLLRRVGEFGLYSDKEFWVYFTSPHPRDMSDEVLEVIAQYPCLAKQIHLPIQSGDNEVLKRMNRRHTFEDYQRIIHAIHRLLPTATIFTDIIVGFTGETEEEFENTRKAMEINRYNMAYIAQYSPRPGAASAKWDDDVPAQVKKDRLHILTEELTKHTILYNQRLVGQTLRILVTGHDRKPGYYSGMTEGRIVIRFSSAQPVEPGTLLWMKVTAAAPYSVEGELVHQPVAV